MFDKRTWVSAVGAVGLALGAMAGPAMADGEYGGGMKDEPTAEERKLALTFTFAVVSDYVFRGISQTREDPAFQPSIDLTYGMFYAGVWGSTLDFGDDILPGPPFFFGEDAQVEIDVYAGIRPTWNTITFDFGVLGYLYPSASDDGLPGGPNAELDYLEIKAGYSATGLLIPKLTAGTNLYYSPEYGGNLGQTLAVETTVAYELPQIAMFTPTISGMFGTLYGDDKLFEAAFSDDEYYYWNAGVTLAVDKFTIDLRYWDTELQTAGAFKCQDSLSGLFDCGPRFVGTVKVTLP